MAKEIIWTPCYEQLVFKEQTINGTKGIDMYGIVMPEGEISRNGVLYEWDSVKQHSKELIDKPIMYNHVIEGTEAVSLGHYTDSKIMKVGDIQYDPEYKILTDKINKLLTQGKLKPEQEIWLYKANLDSSEEYYINKIRRGDLQHVSIQLRASGTEEKFDVTNGNAYTKAYVGDIVECSIVPTPGFLATCAVLAERYAKKSYTEKLVAKIAEMSNKMESLQNTFKELSNINTSNLDEAEIKKPNDLGKQDDGYESKGLKSTTGPEPAEKDEKPAPVQGTELPANTDTLAVEDVTTTSAGGVVGKSLILKKVDEDDKNKEEENKSFLKTKKDNISTKEESIMKKTEAIEDPSKKDVKVENEDSKSQPGAVKNEPVKTEEVPQAPAVKEESADEDEDDKDKTLEKILDIAESMSSRLSKLETKFESLKKEMAEPESTEDKPEEKEEMGDVKVDAKAAQPTEVKNEEFNKGTDKPAQADSAVKNNEAVNCGSEKPVEDDAGKDSKNNEAVTKKEEEEEEDDDYTESISHLKFTEGVGAKESNDKVFNNAVKGLFKK